MHLLKMINDGVLFEEQAAQIVKRIQFASSHDELNRALAEIKEQEEMQEEQPRGGR